VSTRQTGNARENRCGDLLRIHGYEPFYSRGSRGVDILAVKADGYGPHLQIAVIRPNGGSVRQSFVALRAAPVIAGSRQVVAKEIKRNAWRWYWDEDYSTESFPSLLLEIQEVFRSHDQSTARRME